ncbi:MAG: glucose-6-phosphate isomerase [Sphaerochaeta sp.]|jgi:glucose-6-phosphate isomerase|nr:MAG: glucose-6-phosphate isomerase [Sphaerochaeta sp.]
MKYINLTEANAFKALERAPQIGSKDLLTKERILSCSVPSAQGVAYNYAAMPVTEEVLDLFQALSDELQLTEKYQILLDGAVMNTGEKRLVLHHLTRGQIGKNVMVDGENKGEFYRKELSKVQTFAKEVRSKSLLLSTGKPVANVVQIGIGGSDLGPRALYLALKEWAEKEGKDHIPASFISNVDPDDPSAVLSALDAEETLFILVSKSGTTLETLTNQRFVEAWLKKRNPAIDPSKHIVAVTSKTSPLAKSKEVFRSFFFDDYVGGRYSSTSAVGGVILSIAFGFEVFEALLKGAHEADKAALHPHVKENAALLDALIGVYLRNVLHYPTTAILPYSQGLSRFPAHLQQLDMESNGKQVNRDGKPVAYPTGPVIFGEPGTNGQHSFYQLLHQGTDIVPLQFIGFSESQRKDDIAVADSTSQEKLVANLVAQIVAFALGKDDDNPNKRFEGNRPSSLLYAKRLTPEVLGTLLAHYENKVMFQGFVWNLNSFDQEGVQLGKVLATKVLQGAAGDEILQAYRSLF